MLRAGARQCKYGRERHGHYNEQLLARCLETSSRQRVSGRSHSLVLICGYISLEQDYRE